MTTKYSLSEICEGCRRLKKILDGWMKEDTPRCVAAENMPGEVADFLDCVSAAYLNENSLGALLAVYNGDGTREKVRDYFNSSKYRADMGLQGLARQELIKSVWRRSGIHISKPLVLSEKGIYLAELFVKNLVDVLYQQAKELISKELPDKIIEAERQRIRRENRVYPHLHELMCLLGPEGRSIEEIREQLRSDLGRNLYTKPLKRALDFLIKNNSCVCVPCDDGLVRYKLPDAMGLGSD